jgi:hypothetical protein
MDIDTLSGNTFRTDLNFYTLHIDFFPADCTMILYSGDDPGALIWSLVVLLVE